MVAFSETVLYIIWQSKAANRRKSVSGSLKGTPTTELNSQKTVELSVTPTSQDETPRESKTAALTTESVDSPDVQLRHRKAPNYLDEED